jgi:anti-sigma B factor antagonist
MNLSIDRHAVDGAVRLAIAGEVDIATAGQLRRAILTALTDVRTEELTVDLDQVTFLDSSGIQALLRGHAIAAERGITCRVTNPCAIVRRVMEITGVLDMLVRPLTPLSPP